MTERQEHILRIIGDPISTTDRLSQFDKTAIRTALAERNELLAVAEALLRYHGVTLDEPRQPLAEIADMACNAIAKATGGTS